jgi:hypothetical protein
MTAKGHWVTLPYKVVAGYPGLRISPMGVVPQKERRPRTIVDYSYSDLNDDTWKKGPQHAMQFGKALWRVLQTIVYADPRAGPVYLFKLDVADGFYRVWVRPPDVLKLGVAFPVEPGEEPIVAFPLALPMGWVESPPYFCAITETITDLANERVRRGQLSTSRRHRLDEDADSRPAIEPPPEWWEPTSGPPMVPMANFDVYMDDFIGAAQGEKRLLEQYRRTLFEVVDSVLRPLEKSDEGTNREEPVSVKKLRKGDGAWHTRKVILGWQVDTVALTIELTATKALRLDSILDIPRTKKHTTLRDWQKLLGELRHMSFAIPGGKHMFSVLQHVVKQADARKKVPLSTEVHDALEDMRWMVHDLTHRPTHLYEWFPDERCLIGACDASKAGMGGVWFLEESEEDPPHAPNSLASAVYTECAGQCCDSHQPRGVSHQLRPRINRHHCAS